MKFICSVFFEKSNRFCLSLNRPEIAQVGFSAGNFYPCMKICKSLMAAMLLCFCCQLFCMYMGVPVDSVKLFSRVTLGNNALKDKLLLC